MAETVDGSTSEPDDRGAVSVLGAGIMGSGIAQVAAMRGYQVIVRDVGAAELARGVSAIETSLGRFTKGGRLTTDDAAAARARIATTTSLEEALGGTAFVIEAVPEILELKQEVLVAAAEIAPGIALLCTNTSQLSITTIGEGLGESAGRLVGTHFFNPPVLMQLVELVRGGETSDDVFRQARVFAESLGKTVVECKDSPGFITTRAYAALRLECLRMLEEGIATAEDIDTALKLGFNFPMGPLELGDFNGLDSFLRVLTSLEQAHGERFRPTAGFEEMVAAGRLGRKTGQGFYRYDDAGARIEAPPAKDDG